MPTPFRQQRCVQAAIALAIVIAALWLVLIGAALAGALLTRYLWTQILPPQPAGLVPIPPVWPPTPGTLFIISTLLAGFVLTIAARAVVRRIVEHVLPPE